MTSAVSPGARDQVARLLTLVPYLHHRDEVRLDDAAELLGTTPAQVLNDLKVLFMVGLPGGLPDDLIDVDLDAIETEDGGPVAGGVIRVDNADYLARPMRLSPTEASALTVALHALRESSPLATRAVVDSVLAKLEQAAASAAAERTLAIATEPTEERLAALAATLERAVASGRQVRLTYYVPSRDEVSERVVDPRGIVSSGRFSYLDAWCHSAGAMRFFRLDRIDRAEQLDTPVATEPAPPRAVTTGLLAGEAPEGGTTVRLLLRPEADWVPEYYPVEEVLRRDDGMLEVAMVVADQRWLIRLLLRLAPYAAVVSPEEFTHSFAAAAREALALYD
jgi:proteasome accessory factor C